MLKNCLLFYILHHCPTPPYLLSCHLCLLQQISSFEVDSHLRSLTVVMISGNIDIAGQSLKPFHEVWLECPLLN